MMNLAESIREQGIITPATLRKKEDGRYEILSGHRRKRACELARLETLRSEVVEIDRDAAVIFMVDSNLQRTTILPKRESLFIQDEAGSYEKTGKADRLNLCATGAQVKRSKIKRCSWLKK